MSDRIAVITPVYNVTSFLEEAVRSAAMQHCHTKKIIVVDDGSSKEAAAEIERVSELYGATLLRHSENRGPAAARRTGLAHTDAELIIFLDGDDVLLDGALQYFAEAMQRNPFAVATYANTKAIDRTGNFLNEPFVAEKKCTASGREVLLLLLERKLRLPNGSICIRRQVLEALTADIYDLKLEESWILSCHLALSGEIVPAGDRVVMHRRMHADNISYASGANLSALFPLFDRVYKNPAFISAVGEETMRRIRKRISNLHDFYQASEHAGHSDLEKAALFFRNIHMPLSSLFDSKPE